MDMMVIRRRVLLGGKKVIDTSPKIAGYNKRLRGNLRVENFDGLCVTEWIDVNPQLSKASNLVFPDVYPDTYYSMFQYMYADGTNNWSYYPDMKFIGASSTKIIVSVRFTIPIDKLDTCYAYNDLTGQIFFASNNSPYYGYTNINDMP